VREGQISLKELTIKEDLTYEEYSVRIFEKQQERMRGLGLSGCAKFSEIGITEEEATLGRC